ncbi:hypothetical protein I5F07_03560 [Proteus vulgaris]|uniref:hypothetical protein n=1 Tax=Proteus TaxID=583 RepID=UPI000B4135E8|nr:MULTISPECIES: hypothetical protein [Proteus]NBN61067.1 hypothetical protein [Proteus sp. G2639]RNT29315.1 hypothetical protein B9475_008730 [Proteus mirabilis]MBG5971561.1 hypothetical protein [Proteus vulgaris]MBG5983944.1 hypothetical protein [Proteus vulgaris]MBI6511316.1 hypothetical protein [Proteus sp. PR00174]
MKVSVNNEHIIKENRNITPSMGDGLSGLFNNLSQVKNSCKAFLIGDEKLKSKNIQSMCDEILQRFIPKEGTREYELIEIEALPDMASSRISYTKSSKSVTELFNILENELKKISGMDYTVLTLAQKKYVNKIIDTFKELFIQANKNIKVGSSLATNYNLIAHIKALNTDKFTNKQ